jgi:hypothetical protein
MTVAGVRDPEAGATRAGGGLREGASVPCSVSPPK